MNPCAALRFSGSNIDSSKIPLFCSQEAYIKNGLPKVIRVLITTYVEKNQDITHVYINGAEKLRPDFCKK
jgi:chorismate mutase